MMADLIRNFINRNYQIITTIGIGSQQTLMQDIHLSYEESLYALKYKAMIGCGTNILIDDVKVYDEKQFFKIFSMSDNVMEALKNGDKEMLDDQLEVIFEKAKQTRLPPDMLRQICLRLIIEAVKLLMDSGISTGHIFEEKGNDPHRALNECSTINQMHTYVCSTLQDFVHKLSEKHCSKRSVDIIESLLKYIDARYMDSNLSLDHIANAFHLSVPYLSKIFKDHVGNSFINYLIDLRVGKAKELLALSDKKVNDVAEAVGYINYHSFARIFKKYTGITPNEFRTKSDILQALNRDDKNILL